jgi:hypothetical protein
MIRVLLSDACKRYSVILNAWPSTVSRRHTTRAEQPESRTSKSVSGTYMESQGADRADAGVQLDEDSIAALIRFFRLLDKWDHEVTNGKVV